MDDQQRPDALTVDACVETLKKCDELIWSRLGNQRQLCDVVVDSRQVKAGSGFIAICGQGANGHQYVSQAVAAGASLVIVQQEVDGLADSHVNVITVKSTRRAWAWLMASQCAYDRAELPIYGVTGTNGKTSIGWFFHQICHLSQVACGLIGTLGVFHQQQAKASIHTTPDPNRLFSELAQMHDSGQSMVIMEVSSHGLAQEKLGPLMMSGVVFSSFSRDHLDFHGSMQDYFRCKWRLITEFRQAEAPLFLHHRVAQLAPSYGCVVPKQAILYGENLLERSDRCLSYQVLAAELDCTEVELTWGSLRCRLSVPLVNSYQIENFIAAWGLAHRAGIVGVEHRDWSSLQAVPGRLQQVATPQQFPQVFIDYAHTPDGIKTVLQALRPFTEKRLVVVFGCGGDRDRGKRPLMGSMAQKYADYCVVTSDNPRTEDPLQIIEHIVGAYQSAAIKVEPDRKLAIQWALDHFSQGDVVVIAGKGHETYQILASSTIAFDDGLVVREYLGN